MENTNARNIGIQVSLPKSKGEDVNCPFYGNIRLRGRVTTATVVASKIPRTATVRLYRRHYLPKYQRFEERVSKLRVHNPASINAKEGDIVKIAECRPISKTKRFVIIDVIGKEELRKITEEETNESS